jgi:CDP-diglyceride synthetase
MTPSVIKHIDIIQSTITRMAANSFFLKSWTVTLVSAMFALAAKDSNQRYLFIAYFPAIVFWILDGYFLLQEQLYRSLFNSVRLSIGSDSDFSMDTTPFKAEKRFGKAFFSKTLLIFYGGILMTIMVVMFVVKK